MNRTDYFEQGHNNRELDQWITCDAWSDSDRIHLCKDPSLINFQGTLTSCSSTTKNSSIIRNVPNFFWTDKTHFGQINSFLKHNNHKWMWVYVGFQSSSQYWSQQAIGTCSVFLFGHKPQLQSLTRSTSRGLWFFSIHKSFPSLLHQAFTI